MTRLQHLGPGPLFVLVTALLWLGCVGTASAQLPQTCSTHGCLIDMPPDKYVLNNHWNTNGNPIWQSITVKSPTAWSTSWDFDRPENWTVTTYAAVISGWHWGWRYPPAEVGLPVQVSSRTPINAQVAFNYVPDPSCGVSRVCRVDIAYDVWFHDNPNPGTSTPAYEMMIWLAYSRDLFVGYPALGYANIGGHRWKAIQAHQTYTAFVLDEPADLTAASLNITEFVDWLVQNRGFPTTWWVDSVQFGPEVYKGKGTLNVTSYAVSVGDSGTTAPPPAATLDFASSATASPNPVPAGEPVGVTARVTASAPASNVIVDLEIYDAANTKVGQRIFTGQAFDAGVPRTYSWSWPGTAATGPYTVRIGVFSADWKTLYDWNGQAGSFSVQAGASAPTDFTLSAAVSPSTVPAGQPATITAAVTASGPASNTVVDVEVYDPADVRVGQQVYTGQSFASGASRTYSWAWPGTTKAGTHKVRVGVFSADWATLHEWNHEAATFSVAAGPTVSASATASPTPIRRGRTLTVNGNVVSTTAIANARIDLEIYNAAGARVGQRICTKGLPAGQVTSCAWRFTVRLPAGTYTVRLGVFSYDWTKLYKWVNQAATFVVR
jgi:hypothetical protein